jgi:uncharacterized protein (UPF0335 family)
MTDGNIAADQLRQFIESIESLENERKSLAADVRDIYSEAKACGFDPKAMRAVLKLRSMDDASRNELDAMVGVYREVLSV